MIHKTKKRGKYTLKNIKKTTKCNFKRKCINMKGGDTRTVTNAIANQLVLSKKKLKNGRGLFIDETGKYYIKNPYNNSRINVRTTTDFSGKQIYIADTKHLLYTDSSKDSFKSLQDQYGKSNISRFPNRVKSKISAVISGLPRAIPLVSYFSQARNAIHRKQMLAKDGNARSTMRQVGEAVESVVKAGSVGYYGAVGHGIRSIVNKVRKSRLFSRNQPKVEQSVIKPTVYQPAKHLSLQSGPQQSGPQRIRKQ